MTPAGFTRDEQTGHYFSPDDGGIWFDPESKRYFSVSRQAHSDRLPFSDAPANGPAPLTDCILDGGPAAANAASRTQGPADQVFASYRRLGASERMRFWLLLDEWEEAFSLEDVRRLDRGLHKNNVSPDDKAAFDEILRKAAAVGEVLPGGMRGTANGRGGTIRGARHR